MNKKLRLFLFAIGIGVASAPAMASCYYYCNVDFHACLNDGGTYADCYNAQAECQRECDGG